MNIRQVADRIPDLGHGGHDVGETLIRLAKAVPDGQAIVDIAPWLGSTTAYLALGVIQAGTWNTIHAFDLWEASPDYVKKARKYNGLDLEPGQNLLPLWNQNMRPFNVAVRPHRGDIQKARWTDGPIGLIVDDISNTAELISSTMMEFAPHLVPGGKLVLMDWGFHEERDFPHQRKWMDRNGAAFKMVERCPEPGKAAVFVRLTGRLVA